MKNKTIFLLLLLLPYYISWGQEYYFKHYQVEDGLSHNTVQTAIQGKQGFLWFGTKDGLNRFDGYHFKTFRNSVNDSTSIGSNYIECLLEFNDTLWVGTDSGVYHYNENKENFDLIKVSKNRPILDIEHDNKGNLWYIGGSTLFKYNIASKETKIFDTEIYFHNEELTRTPDGEIWTAMGSLIRHYKSKTNSFNEIKITSKKDTEVPIRINKLFALDNNTILIGTRDHGVFSYDIKNRVTKHLMPEITEPLFVRDFIKGENGELWIATELGIYIYNFEDKSYKNLRKSYNNPYSLSDNAVYTLARDKEGGIWIGTYFGGINYYPKQYTTFHKYFPKISENSISGNAVREIREDKDGNLWIGTEDAGLNKLNPKTGIFTNYNSTIENSTLSHYNIHGILPQDETLWIGTFEHGIDIMNTKTEKVIKTYKTDGNSGLSSNFAFTLYEGKNNQIYVVTTSGVQIFDPKTNKFSTIEAFPEGIFFTSFMEDSKGILWAGTYWNGLFFYDPSTNKSGVYSKQDLNVNNGISSNAINGIFEDSEQNIWITTENGLNLFHRNSKDFKKYDVNDGFPSSAFYAIIEDRNNLLWITTSKGLVSYNPKTEHKSTYTKANGLLSDQFNYNSAYKDEHGTMYFGSVNGMISFNPENFIKNNYKPTILITGFKINNEEVPLKTKGSPLTKSITFTNKIQLQPDQTTFSLDFSALSFTAPEMTDYWFKLKGLHEDWVYLQKKHSVYFTELPSGKYDFMVKSLNNNGVWSEEVSTLKIEILPVFWKSSLAYSLYILCTILATLVVLRLYNSRIKIKNFNTLREINNKKEKEIFQSKIEFFTNVSHEIRTPLTLIKSPLEKLLKNVEPGSDLSDNLNIMDKNTSRLLDLTNQLLDFRKAELENMALTFVKTNISLLLKDTHTRFSQIILEKNIEFDIVLNSQNIYAYVDAEALKKILSNLLNNAIKYADQKVIVSLTSSEDSIQLTVKNDGVLIPAHLKNKIFEPFFREQEVKNDHQPGTGIGLSLAQSLTDLHKGNLYLDTSDANMNIFVLKLPIHQEKEFKLKTSETSETVETKGNLKIDTEHNSPSILLVEDNIDLLDFVAKELNIDYVVFKAENAEIALRIIATENIHLIVSDVMMPGMDGFKLCEKLKTDLETSHIPIILLTARSAIAAKIEGLEIGADAYIEKPFSMTYLKVQIANLIENREHILNYYSSSPLAHVRSLAHTKTDESFIKKLDDIIFKNISDPKLSVESLADAMHMSRSTFYRKIKEMSNLSPNELVNITRLKKAAELLKLGDYKIYEVAEMVGYNSQTSFGRNFQKQFNMTPSEYMND
ncbi:response regulator [Aureibaculum algae]|uniref:histidine kinase n=1 Tax=Aureibaculum algae TaxID=2584122 RepID=A0A5B7TQ87_9FLAO|nr:hybrid sensor histidine kinase/response regulator transcription factor [Aureibaculum algae]QCX37414.1 response regulator [Aureibaculum algae]